MIGAPFGQVILCTPRDDCTLMFNALLTADRVLLPGRLRGSMLTDVAGEHIRWLSCRHILNTHVADVLASADLHGVQGQ